MECLHGPKALVILEIKEGNGFAFFTNGLVAVASFCGISLETEVVTSANRTKFEHTLTWEIETKYLRKLRSSNTALKVEFYSCIKNSERDRIGYVHLNLKEAKIGSSLSANKEVGSWHNLLCLKKAIIQAHKPEVFLSFRIEDWVEMNADSIEFRKNVIDSEQLPGPTEAKMVDRHEEDQLVLKPIQIGPPTFCTELYQFSISFLAVDRLIQIIPPEKLGKSFKINFAIFGTSLFTDEIPSTVDNGVTLERLSFDIWSRNEFLSAYFKEFPTLVFSFLIDDELIGNANFNLEVLCNLTNNKSIAINSILPIYSVAHDQDIQFGIKEDFSTIQVGLDLIYKSGYISTKVDQEIQTCQKTSAVKVDAVTNTEENEILEHSLTKHEGNFLSAKMFPEKEPSANRHLLNHTEEESENTSLKSSNSLDKSQFSPKLSKETTRGSSEFVLRSPPHTFRLNTSSGNHPIDLSKEYIRDAALRACEELEDWKEKQQQMFEFELKKKTERRLKKLSNEWVKHKQQLEDDLEKKIEDCQNLKEKLTDAFQDLTRRCETVSQREQELELAREELDKTYNMKFQELRKASRLCEYDMEDKINIVKVENLDLQRKLEESGKEIIRLQEALLSQESSALVRGGTSGLINEVKTLEQKLEKALESKAFFKEQWGKAVRELHRMKEEEQHQLKIQMQKNRQELQTLGLVKEISNEVGEMKKDQFVIKNIRNELSNFFPSGGPVVDVNCFSGT